MNKEIHSSGKIYQSLQKTFGKKFTDEKILQIFGFDETLDKLEYGQQLNEKIGNIPQKIIHTMAHDIDMAIYYATKKIQNDKNKLLNQYIFDKIGANPTKEELQNIVLIMIEEVTNNLDSQSIDKSFIEYYLMFSFSTDLLFYYNKKIGKIDNLYGVNFLPNMNFNEYLHNTTFEEKFITYLIKFNQRMDDANEEERNIVYFMIQTLRQQSGDREGIGNTLNPMIQFMTLDNYLGKRKEKRGRMGIIEPNKSLTQKLINTINKTSQQIRDRFQDFSHSFPYHSKHNRWIADKQLKKIIYTYFFPQSDTKS